MFHVTLPVHQGDRFPHRAAGPIRLWAAWALIAAPLLVAAEEPPPADAPPVADAVNPSIQQHGAGKTLYSFKATDLELKAALALFARANNLNIVPDQDVTGQVTVDIKDLPLEQMMQALLDAHDYSWSERNGLIRVRSYETRTFHVDYLRLQRTGSGQSSATLASGTGGGGGGGGMGGAMGGGGMSGGGGGGGGMGGAMGGGMGGGMGGSGGGGGSAINLSQENAIDFWKELKEEITSLLSAKGKDNLAINMTAGVIQITDRPAALKRVEEYLKSLEGSVQRQVDIEAKLYDVTLGDQFQLGVDWQHAIEMYSGYAVMAGSPSVVAPAGGVALKDAAFSLVFSNANTKVMLQALQEQGEVKVISKPRIRTLNNQTALIKVGTETPFFSKSATYLPGYNTVGGTTTIEQDTVTSITVGTILAITPQISSNNWITLDISPVLTSLVDTKISPSRNTTAPVLDIKQASTLVRVLEGNTVVLGGLIQDSHAKTLRKIPLVGDIPVLGLLFQGKFDAKQKKELVIFITPTIVR